MPASRARRIAVAVVTSLSLVLGIAPAVSAETAPAKPSSMAATGDSITRAFNLCVFPFTDCPARSWSTGNNSTVNSHARRLGITGSAFNDAVSGARMSNLPTQMATVANRNVGYVTVLMGGNDVCTDSEAGMTHPDAYEADFRRAMELLRADSTPPLVYVVSIPNVKMLWEILHQNSSARSAWSAYGICQSLLADPLSSSQADVDRRERVKQRNMELNQRLRAVCDAYAFCRFDGGGAFGTDFVANDVSTRDYFHPSTAGQAKLADVSYRLGYWAGAELLPVNDAPTAAFSPPTSCTVGVACSFVDASTDPGEVIEGRSWQFGDGATSTAASATHTFAAAGTFNVTLYAIDAAGATSSVTHAVQVVSGSGGDTTAPAAPSGLAATGGDGSVSLTWTANSESDLAGYEVHRSTADAGPYELIGTAPEAAAPSFSDTTVVNGTTYHYVVKAVDDVGNRSLPSEPVSATPQAPSGGGGEPTSMHVSDLEGSTQLKGKSGKWEAFVTVTVVDAAGNRVGGVAVTGDWSGATSGTATLTTAADGTATFATGALSGGAAVTFTVVTVVGDGFVYDADANTDADGDSDGTSITVLR